MKIQIYYLTRAILLGLLLTILFAGLSAAAQNPEHKELFLVEINSKKGFIDRTGKIVIPPVFDQASNFDEGIARVWINCEPCERRFINTQGKFVRNAIFDDGPQLEFAEGLAAVKIGELIPGRYGFVDNTGLVIIQPQFKIAFRFSEGLAAVVTEDNLTGYIDHTGKMIVKPKFESAWEFQEGLARFIQNDKWGFIDKSGEVAIPPQFDDVSDFYEGLAMIQVNYRRGYIDRTGRIIIRPKFKDCYEFSNGLAYVRIGKKYGFIDRSGKLRIGYKFDTVRSFSQGLAAVSIGGKHGFIDSTGKVVIPLIFASADSFAGGLAYVSIESASNEKISAYLDKAGKYIWTSSNHDYTKSIRTKKDTSR